MLQNFGDEGSNTLGHIESAAGQIYCPNLKSIGLGRVADISDTGESIKGALAAWLSLVLVKIRLVVIGR